MQAKKKSSKAQSSHEMVLKVIIIGDSGVGKTNILTSYCEGIFKDSYVATIGVDFKVKIVHVEARKVKLQIWDTAGQQRFKNITKTYYKGAAGIILVYAINNNESFKSIHHWLNQINASSQQNSCKILIGTKCDLTADRQVDTDDGQRLAQKHNMLFMEVSAKTGDNINELFVNLSKEILKKRTENDPGVDIASVVNLTDRKGMQKKKCEC